MDLLTLFGVLLGGAAVIAGFSLEGGHVVSLLQPEALIIVLGGVIDEQADAEVNRDWDKGELDAAAANAPLLGRALHLFRDNGRENSFETGLDLIIAGLEQKLATGKRR